MTELLADDGPARRRAATWTWVGGNVLLAFSVSWLIIDRLLVRNSPLQWGGPNFGRGALILLAGLGVLAGAVVLVVAVIMLTGARRSSTEGAEDVASARGERAVEVGGPRSGWWALPAAVNLALVVALVAVLVTLPAPSEDEDVAGAVGVTVTASGSPVLVLGVCRGSVDTVTVVGPNRGTQPNEQLARLTSPTGVTAQTSVDLVRPAGGWAGTPLPTAPQELFIADAQGPGSRLLSVSFTAGDLKVLDPATVLYAGSDPAGNPLIRRTPITGFAAQACSGTDAGA